MGQTAEQDAGSTGAPRWFAVSVLALLGGAGIVHGILETTANPVAPIRDLSAHARSPDPRTAGVPDTARTIDVNSASAAELDLLPGIGPALAGRIIEHREVNGPFGSVGELDAVRGIGPRTIEKLTPFASAQ